MDCSRKVRPKKNKQLLGEIATLKDHISDLVKAGNNMADSIGVPETMPQRLAIHRWDGLTDKARSKPQ